jgi:hypothetical protein
MKLDEQPNGKGFLTYKGYPLVRKDDEIYFGSMDGDYFVRIQILHKKNTNGLDVADKVMVYKVSTDEKLSLMEAIVRSGEKTSLYDALDLAIAWLKRKE